MSACAEATTGFECGLEHWIMGEHPSRAEDTMPCKMSARDLDSMIDKEHNSGEKLAQQGCT
jgi:hypothetical protein